MSRRAGVSRRPVCCLGSHVYFAEAKGFGLLKIGHCDDIARRFKQLQALCPTDLVLVAVARGGREMEHELHARFKHLRVKGEWFKNEGDLATLLGALGSAKTCRGGRGLVMKALPAYRNRLFWLARRIAYRAAHPEVVRASRFSPTSPAPVAQ